MKERKKTVSQGALPDEDLKSIPDFILNDLDAMEGEGVPDIINTPSSYENDPLAGKGFGPDILERLILAVVKENPISDVSVPRVKAQDLSDKRRFELIFELLVGKAPTAALFPTDLDRSEKYENALRMMAREESRLMQADDQLPVGKTKSAKDQRQQKVPQLSAMDLAKAILPSAFPDASANNSHAILSDLVRLWSGSHQQKRSAFKSVGREQQIDTTRYRALRHDYIVESIEQQGLEKIANILRQHGYKVSL